MTTDTQCMNPEVGFVKAYDEAHCSKEGMLMDVGEPVSLGARAPFTYCMTWMSASAVRNIAELSDIYYTNNIIININSTKMNI